MNTSTTRRHRPHLTPAERAELVELIEADPLGTCKGLALRFERLTGRAICPNTVRRAWMGDYRDPAARMAGPLTEAQRATLTRICRESAPPYNRAEIARQFQAETGRRIERTVVRYHLRKTLSITAPPLLGRPRKAVTA